MVKKQNQQQMDQLLFISNTFEPRNGNVVGGKLSLDNLSSYFLASNEGTQTANEIGTCKNKIVTLLSSDATKSNENQIDFGQNIPIDTFAQRKVICLSYYEELFKRIERIEQTKSVFKLLHSNLNKTNEKTRRRSTNAKKVDNLMIGSWLSFYFTKIFSFVHLILCNSHWFAHLERNIHMFFNATNRKRSSIITRNLYSSKIIDFFLGTITLYFLLEHRSNVLESILQSTKFIIDGLKHVLNSLMDSPAGLKLNYALNHTLAIFFFYHISLWRTFIQSIFTVSPSIVYVFAALGSFGLSYQIALCADLIMFLTFHVYCIYVYAARFYRLQIYTITSLWRLFIGRKYNPLKHRVDSFQYSHNQLFIGTLGFTILLFLLPTTFLYYIVFTMFRIWVLIVCKCLHSIARFLSAVPVYLIILRFIGSPSIKGSIRIYITKNPQNKTLRLHASLDLLKDWFTTENLSSSTLDKPETTEISLNEYVKRVGTGKLL